MKSIKKKTAFILAVAVLTICLAAPAFAGSYRLEANSTWDSTVNAKVVALMADGICYASLNYGSQFQESWVGSVSIVYSTSASRWIFALTSTYGANVNY